MTEEELLQYLIKKLSPLGTIGGVGDDCAVIDEGDRWLLFTTDALVEGIHFDLSYFSPSHLGKKLAAVNLSDIAAMGGRPKYGLLTIGFSSAPQESFVKPFFDALETKLSQFGAYLVGGDIVKSPQRMFLNLVLLGEIAPGAAIFRSGANPGDLIFVSRPLGAASAGLELLQKGLSLPNSLACAQLEPEPEVELGQLLAESGLVSAMMDISDGLALDLTRLCQASTVGAEIEEESIPIAREIFKFSLSKEPIWYALSGGEDFALLFTVPPEKKAAIFSFLISTNRKPYLIGKIIDGNRVYLKQKDGIRKDISYLGFIHFG